MATYNFELNCRPSQRGTYVVLFRITENKNIRESKRQLNFNLQTIGIPRSKKSANQTPISKF